MGRPKRIRKIKMRNRRKRKDMKIAKDYFKMMEKYGDAGKMAIKLILAASSESRSVTGRPIEGVKGQ